MTIVRTFGKRFSLFSLSPLLVTVLLSFTSFALASYFESASSNIEKSSSGVQDVELTKRAGRSLRRTGLVALGEETEMKESDIIPIPRAISSGDVPGGLSLVKGVEFGISYSGRKDFRDCVVNVFDIFENSCMAGCSV